MSKSRKDVKLILNNQDIYRHYRTRLINLALARYQWENLPEDVNRLYLEKTALEKGSVAMMRPEGTDFWLGLGFIPVSSKGKMTVSKEMVSRFLTEEKTNQMDKYFNQGIRDVYGNPTNIIGIGANGEQIVTKEWDFFYDTMTKTTIMKDIDLYAYQLWLIHQTFNQNVRLQNNPYIITTNRNKSLTFKNLFNRILGFEPTIQIAEGIDLDDINTLDLKVPFIGNDLTLTLEKTWARALSMLGISTESDKRERLVADEVNMSMQETVISGNVGLLNRMEFCKRMNEKYDLNMSVKMSDIDSGLVLPRGREYNEPLHNSNTREIITTQVGE